MLLLIAACLPDLQAPTSEQPGQPVWTDTSALTDDTDTGELLLTDADSDGFYAEEDDCNDQDGEVHPGAEDLCDGRDQDCDGLIDEDALGDPYEPNDQQASGLGALYNASLEVEATLHTEQDVDRFAVEIGDPYWIGPAIEVRLGDIGANSDYAIALYGPDGSLIASADDKTAGRAEKLNWAGQLTAQESGTYVVEIYSVGGADCARSYTLEITEG